MPNLVGMSQSEAEKQLSSLKMKVGQVTTEYSDQPKGTVIRQSIVANSKTAKGSSVDLVLSKGKEVKKVSVPDVRGQSVESAKATLSAQGLNVTASASSGEVTAQSIPAGSSVDSGSTIELTVSGSNASSNSANSPDKATSNSNSNGQTREPSTSKQSSTPSVQIPQRQKD